jgi:hypothetical protein
VNIDPRTPAGQLFADRALSHENIKSQLAYARVAKVAKDEHRPVPSRAVVAAAQIAVAKASKTPDLVAVYDSTGTLLGVVPQDRMVDVPAGSAVYDSTGKATGIVDTAGKLTLLSDGPDAVAKVAKSIAAQGAAVAKRLQGHRVSKGLSPTPTRRGKPINAVEWLTALGLRINAERVSKGMIPATSDTKPVPPLLAAALVYAKSSPVQKAAINRVLAKATPASRKAARVALLNVEADVLGPRPTVPRR